MVNRGQTMSDAVNRVEELRWNGSILRVVTCLDFSTRKTFLLAETIREGGLGVKTPKDVEVSIPSTRIAPLGSDLGLEVRK